jgi:hypothetical protein
MEASVLKTMLIPLKDDRNYMVIPVQTAITAMFIRLPGTRKYTVTGVHVMMEKILVYSGMMIRPYHLPIVIKKIIGMLLCVQDLQ